MADKPKNPLLIPPPPWTREVLGDENFNQLARELCGVEPHGDYPPSLGLTELYEAQQSSQAKIKGDK